MDDDGDGIISSFDLSKYWDEQDKKQVVYYTNTATRKLKRISKIDFKK